MSWHVCQRAFPVRQQFINILLQKQNYYEIYILDCFCQSILETIRDMINTYVMYLLYLFP